MSFYDFEKDYQLLKDLPQNEDIFHLSGILAPEILEGGLDRYQQLYPLFWQLIESNRKNCQKCGNQNCVNRYFLLQLKNKDLSENDFYLLTYMTTYFLDLIMFIGGSKGNLSMAFYVLSKGHDDV